MNRIAELRERAGIRQVDFAKKLNVAQSTVSGWENGKSEPSIDMLRKMASLLNVSVDELIGKEIEKKYLEEYYIDPSGQTFSASHLAIFFDNLPDIEKLRVVQMLKVIYGEKLNAIMAFESPLEEEIRTEGITVEEYLKGDVDPVTEEEFQKEYQI